MTFPEKNNFVVKHASAEYFDSDRKLFERLYPDSSLIPELRKANQYNKTHLDGRILLKILDAVCGETVLENRGIITDHMKEQTAKGTASSEVARPPEEPQADQDPGPTLEAEDPHVDAEEGVDFTIPAKPKSPRKKKAVPKKSTPQ